MSYQDIKRWRQKTKKMMADCLGGECNRCGYSVTMSTLDFHHKNPKTKRDTIANLLRNPRKISLIIEEVKKCILLCRNCHGELHDDLWTLDEIELEKFDKCKLDWYIFKENRSCKFCNNKFEPSAKSQIYCSADCSYSCRFNGLSKKELEKLLWEYPMTQIAEVYNVSDKAVAKWVKKYELQKPPRGYWIKSR